MAKKNRKPAVVDEATANKAKAEKRNSRRAAILFICFSLVLVPVIWYATYASAEEHVVDYRTLAINGDTLSVIFSEKSTSKGNRFDKNNDNYHNGGPKNYGYFLELYDSAANQSLDKIEFQSPVRHIPSKPQLRVFPTGVIWLVSTSQDFVEDKPGFILKFKIENQKIIQVDFALNEKYRIRDMEKNWVIITDGNKFDESYYDPTSAFTYLDLETEKINVHEAWY